MGGALIVLLINNRIQERSMNSFNKRASERRDSLNILDYVILGKDGNPIKRGMGRTLNISEKGMLLETHIPIAQYDTLLLTVGLEEDMVEIRGKVTHVKSSADDNFQSGIEFMEIYGRDKIVLKKFIEARNRAM